MFEDSLIESGGVLKKKRCATTAASLILQSALVTAFAGSSLVYTQALPQLWVTARIGSLPPASAPAAATVEHRAVRPVESDMIGQKLREPREIPKNIAQIRESQVPLPAAPSQELGVVGGTGDAASGNLLTSIMNLATAAAIPKPAISGPTRVSQGVERGFLVHEVKPAYPWHGRRGFKAWCCCRRSSAKTARSRICGL